MNVIYKQFYSCGYIKYGYSGNYESRSKCYKTHTGDIITKTLIFPNKDRVDELGIKEYITRILEIKPVKGCLEIFEDPGNLDFIDNDITLESFYRKLIDQDYIPPGSGKLAGLLKKRVLSLYQIFNSSCIDDIVIKSSANLIESSGMIGLDENPFIKARSDFQYKKKVLDSGITIRDILDVWFKWDWEILKKKGL